MKILNKEKGTILANNAEVAKTPFKRAVGLLDRKSLSIGEALIIQPCNSIHTFFMRFPIDVVFVDTENKVIRVISSLRSFCITSVYWKSKFVIELPSGTLQNTSTVVGDSLEII